MLVYNRHALQAFASRMFTLAGMSEDMAAVVSEVLVEADAMGHDTHGLQLLGAYLDDIASGQMKVDGAYSTVNDNGTVAVWDGNWNCGVWLTTQALEQASRRAASNGIAAVSIGRSHHIACLQAYLPRLTAKGQVPMIVCSDPRSSSVAPFGGLDPVFTPDPMAFGLPTGGDPIMIDMSSSITTNGMAARLARDGGKFSGPWAQDYHGNATDDPSVLAASEKGTLLLTGGQSHGHKGYGMALMVEGLSQGLSGYGRANPEQVWGASVYVQVIDPSHFAGNMGLTVQTDKLVELCHGSRPLNSDRPVRLPGEAANARKREAETRGVALNPDILPGLEARAKNAGVALPSPV